MILSENIIILMIYKDNFGNIRIIKIKDEIDR